MCFDADSHPPIAPIAGAAVNHESTTLTANDGNRFSAFHATPETRTGNGILILPDVRGLHHYYEELALRFAEIGVEALAIDYFGRTAGTTGRGDDFDYGPHVAQMSWEGIQADVNAAAAYLRNENGGTRVTSLFTVGFCLGGRLALLTNIMRLNLAGAISFYGWPSGPHRSGTPAPSESIGQMTAPVLAIFGGADQGITRPIVEEFRAAIDASTIPHEIWVAPDAPHSFFDRKQADFQAQSDEAWARVRRFIDTYGAK